MNQLITQIQELGRDEVIEAALSVSHILVGEEAPRIADIQASLFPDIKNNPYAYIGKVEDLARIILVNVADSSTENHELVEKVVSGTGQKNVVFTGTEIIALSAIGLAVLKMILNPPTYIKRTFKDKDGTEVTEEITRDPNVNFLRSLFEKLIK